MRKIFYLFLFLTSTIFSQNFLTVDELDKKLIDLTGGFGVDSFYFSKQVSEVIHCEIDNDLSTIVAHNYQQLNVKNITTISNDGIDYLGKITDFFDKTFCINLERRSDRWGECLSEFKKFNELLVKAHTTYPSLKKLRYRGDYICRPKNPWGNA